MKRMFAKRYGRLLALGLCLSLLAGCALGGAPAPSPSASPVESAPDVAVNDTLTLAVEPGFTGGFSPFFAGSAGDRTVVRLTQAYLIEPDRAGEPVLHGASGETRSFAGTDYTYYTAGDVAVSEREDGVYYDVTLREDLRFSDGKPVTADDLIFTLYVLLDPAYDGPYGLSDLPIAGLADYRAGMEPLGPALAEAGPGNEDFSLWDQETQTRFWQEGLPAAGAALARSVCDYCIAEGYNAPGDSVAACAASWGYDLPEDAGYGDFWAAMEEKYHGDYAALSENEAATASLWSFLEEDYRIFVSAGDAAGHVAGLLRTGDYSLRLILTEPDATAASRLAVPIAPLHHYGSEAGYDFEANAFGFPKGDLRAIRTETGPLGAGPYVFGGYSGGVVTLEANRNYYKGAPAIRYLNLLECGEEDQPAALAAGIVDAGMVNDTRWSEEQLLLYNNGQDVLDGPVIAARAVEGGGLGYIGIHPQNVKVGDDPGSEASKSLRRAVATVLAVYRQEAVEAWFGDAAVVIEAPVSSASLAAPRPEDEGYSEAYALDAAGEPLYGDGMRWEERYAAAREAALGFFQAAGYTVENGKLAEAPEGAKLEYEILVGGNGKGEHPAYVLLKNASAALSELGFTLTVTDVADVDELYAAYRSGTAELWCAAWEEGPDPDLYPLYHSGGAANYWGLSDDTLDELLEEARRELDPEPRQGLYRSALERLRDWAVEVPLYQRRQLYLFSAERVELSSLPEDMTPWWDALSAAEGLAVK